LAWVGSIPKRPQNVRVDRATEKVKKKMDSPRVFRLDMVWLAVDTIKNREQGALSISHRPITTRDSVIVIENPPVPILRVHDLGYGFCVA
jgi:hypothetical protein